MLADRRPDSVRSPLHRDRALLVVVGVFLLSRAAVYACGVRFDDTPLGYFLQYLDVDLLRHDLARSLWHLHSQPPLFNLLLGLTLKTAPDHATIAFALLWLAFGLTIAVALYRLQIRLGVAPGMACAAAVLFEICPAAILFENWLFYTYPETLLLLLGGLFLHRYTSGGAWRDGAAFFATLAGVVLTRSVFHPLWLLAAGSLALLSGIPARRRTLLLLFPAILAVTFWYGRNALLFGGFSGSSWLGFSVAKMTTFQLDETERRQMVADGTLSRLALITPFSDLRSYGDLLPNVPPTGVPALDEIARPNGASNYNYRGVPALSALYMRDALRVAVHHPSTFVRGSATAYYYYLFPSSIYWFLDGNRSRIRGYDRAYDAIVYGQLLYHEPAAANEPASALAARRFLKVSPVLMLGVPAVMIAGVLLCVGMYRRGRLRSAHGATLLYLVGTALYVTVLSNALEINENYRFRFTIDPLLVILATVTASAAVKRRMPPDTRESTAPASGGI